MKKYGINNNNAILESRTVSWPRMPFVRRSFICAIHHSICFRLCIRTSKNTANFLQAQLFHMYENYLYMLYSVDQKFILIYTDIGLGITLLFRYLFI